MNHRPSFTYSSLGELPYWKFKQFTKFLAEDLEKENKQREQQKNESESSKGGFANMFSSMKSKLMK